MSLDMTTDLGQQMARRLRTELVPWLTTVRADGMPQPTPVWFLWEGETILMYSQPLTQKLRNIASNPNASLHFDGNGYGGNIGIAFGELGGSAVHLSMDELALQYP